MNSNEEEAPFIYQTEAVSVELWRDVMNACQRYETCLLDGEATSTEDFAIRFPGIPKDILTPELERIRNEVLEDPASNDPILDDEGPPSERYLILEEIRSGGMGHVYRAYDRICGRLVALKMIRKEYSDEPRMRRRFLAEVELTADLEHPGVIPIYDQSIDSSGREFYVMRLIHGAGTGTFQQAITSFYAQAPDTQPGRSRAWNATKRREFRKLIESVLMVTDTTAHAHSRGIAHRDLKPSNILIGPYGETLIADWGLAKRIRSAERAPERDETGLKSDQAALSDRSISTSNAQGAGTPGFRAPEILSGSTTANLIAADIYSLGAILECVITGAVSPDSESKDRKLDRRHQTSILPLIAIAEKAMSTDAANRYETARSLRMDLGNWLAGEPVSAYPESLVERIWKWPSRHRLLATAAASGLVIALFASGFFSWFQVSQKRALTEALNTTSLLLEENKRAQDSIEDAFAQRETLALRSIIEFQSLLTLNPSLQSDPRFRSIREKVLQESRSFYENLAKSVDQSSDIDEESLGRLTDAALALVLLETELGNHSDALRTAESACERLRSANLTSQRIDYHLGRMLAFKGNIATRNGWKSQGMADHEQAVRYLEPLVDCDELKPEDRSKAASLWCRAASPMAIGLAAKGELRSATDLLQKILSSLNARQPETFQDALLKLQSYGNLALVRYAAKDTSGAYDALDHAKSAARNFENLTDENAPFREIIEFEVMRGTMLRLESDMMLAEGKVEPAIELQSQSLLQLTKAIEKHPGNADIQAAYNACSSRLQAVLVQNGRIARAHEVAQEWVRLAQKIRQADATDHRAGEFLMLAYHALGHLCESTADLPQAERYYREALSIANHILGSTTASESLLSQLVELNVHLLKHELQANHLEIAESHFDEAIRIAGKLTSLSNGNELIRINIRNKMETALRHLEESDRQDTTETWVEKLREAGLLPSDA